MSKWYRLLSIFICTLCSSGVYSKNYYVDPTSFSAVSIGTQESPWVTLDQVSTASAQFLPGDTVFFRRDRTYSGKLNILSSGNANAPIVFTSYEVGDMPEFDNSLTHIIRLSNKQYIVIDGFRIVDRSVHVTDHSKLANTTYAIVLENAKYCTIKNCDISLVGIGISISGNSTGSNIHDNRIYNLRMLRNTIGGNDDFGATAIVVASSDISVTNNRFEECWGTSYDYLYEGGTVELFGDSVSNNVIAYNIAINNNGFLKVGSISNGSSTDNIIAYNKVVNCGNFAILQDTGLYRTRIKNTRIYNNTVIETLQQLRKPSSLFWMPGEGVEGMITLKNNIFWLSSGINVAHSKFDNGQIIHSNNIYRLSQGVVGLSLNATEFFSPLTQIFTNTLGAPADWNLKLIRGSIAINFGTPVGFSRDFDGIPLFELPDAGALEYDVPIIMADIQHGKCFGDSALITILAKGGVPPYSGTGNFYALAGLKYFSVVDSRGKKDSIKVLIDEPAALSVGVTMTPLSILNPSSSVSALATGGTPPYVYRIDNATFQQSAIFSGLVPGSYVLTVMDNEGCLTNRSINILPYKKTAFAPEQGEKLKIFPNPSNYYFTLNNLNYSSSSLIQLEVYNMKGLLIYSTSGRFEDLISFGHQFPPGTYNVRLQIDSFSQALSIIKL